MQILVFLHGTTIMHRSAVGQPRERCVEQVRTREPSVREFATYVPIGHAVAKLQTWEQQGAAIRYLSSHRQSEHVAQDVLVLQIYSFPEGHVEYRQANESYAEVVARCLPDVLIEDDCESIGGEGEMIAPTLDEAVKQHLRIWIVQEFAGVDDLPDDLGALYRPQEEHEKSV